MANQAGSQQRLFRYLPLSLRLETLGGLATPLVLRGTPLPAERKDTFSTAEDDQSTVELTILFGERPLAAKNIRLGTFQLTGIAPMPRGKPVIRVVLQVDQQCRVHAEASLDGTPLQASGDLEPLAKYLRPSFLEKVKADAVASREDDDRVVGLIEARNRAEALIQQAEKRLAERQGKRTPALDADAVSEAIASVGQALESDNVDRLREATEALQTSLTVEQHFDFSSLVGQPGFESIFAPQFPRPRKPPTNAQSPRMPSSRPRTTRPVNEQSLDVAQRPSSQADLGKIFGGGAFTLDPDLCFVLMPFRPTFTPIYDNHIRPVVQSAGLTCQRADEIRGVSLITRDIWEKINRARFLIADLTGQNANVFYEVGFAHALGKDVLLTTQTMTDVPFDLRSIRCLVYAYTPPGMADFEKTLRETLAALIQSR
jgi:hypothetical protein